MRLRRALGVIIFSFLSTGFAHADQLYSVDQKLQKMKNELHLSDDQANSVRMVIQDYKDRMQHLSHDQENRLNKILSSEQMNKLKRMKEDKKEKAAAWDS